MKMHRTWWSLILVSGIFAGNFLVIFHYNLVIFIYRWGPTGVTDYKANLMSLFQLMKQKFPPYTLVLWLTTAPVSSQIKGAFLIEQV